MADAGGGPRGRGEPAIQGAVLDGSTYLRAAGAATPEPHWETRAAQACRPTTSHMDALVPHCRDGLKGTAIHGACGATLGRVQIRCRLESPKFIGRGRSRHSMAR